MHIVLIVGGEILPSLLSYVMLKNKKIASVPRRVVTRYKKVELDRTFDEISEQEILDARTRTTETTKAYLGILRKLKAFLRVPDDVDIPKI